MRSTSPRYSRCSFIARSARGASPFSIAAIASLRGTILPARDGTSVEIQIHRDGRWRPAISTTVRRGAYAATITQPGLYRAVYRGASGAPVRVTG